jgi:hypothetical protein
MESLSDRKRREALMAETGQGIMIYSHEYVLMVMYWRMVRRTPE